EDETCGVDRGLIKSPLNEREQLGVPDRPAREIDLETQLSPCVALLRYQAHGFARDPAVYRQDQSGALRRVQELSRQDQLTCVARHPQKQLPLRGAIVGQVDDRLTVELE